MLEGVDVAYYLVHSLGAADFEERDRRPPRRPPARPSGRACGRSSTSAGSATTRPTSPRTCAAGARSAAASPPTSVPVTTLRAAIVIGRGSAAFETIVALVDRLPAMICPRWVSTPTQPIALDDVVAYLAGVCGLEAALGQELRRRRARR